MLQKKDNLFHPTTVRVARVVCSSPHRQFHLRELVRATRLSTTAVRSSLGRLRAAGVVVLERTSLALFAQFSDAEDARAYKRILNLQAIYGVGVVPALLSLYLYAEAIVLFGSYARGEDGAQSDIDILVLSSHAPDTAQFRNLFEKRLGRQINLHVLTSLDASEPAFRAAIANGILLHGRVNHASIHGVSSARKGEKTNS